MLFTLFPVSKVHDIWIFHLLNFIICILTWICIHNTQWKFQEHAGCQKNFIWKYIFDKSNAIVTKSSENVSVNKGYIFFIFCSWKMGLLELKWSAIMVKFFAKISWNLVGWMLLFRRHAKCHHYIQHFWLCPYLIF